MTVAARWQRSCRSFSRLRTSCGDRRSVDGIRLAQTRHAVFAHARQYEHARSGKRPLTPRPHGDQGQEPGARLRMGEICSPGSGSVRNLIDFGMNRQEAGEAPRVRHSLQFASSPRLHPKRATDKPRGHNRQTIRPRSRGFRDPDRFKDRCADGGSDPRKTASHRILTPSL